MEAPIFNILSTYATVQDYIDILNGVKEKDKPLIVRTKFIKKLTDDYVDGSNPNLSVGVYKNYCIIELLPLPKKSIIYK